MGDKYCKFRSKILLPGKCYTCWHDIDNQKCDQRTRTWDLCKIIHHIEEEKAEEKLNEFLQNHHAFDLAKGITDYMKLHNLSMKPLTLAIFAIKNSMFQDKPRYEI